MRFWSLCRSGLFPVEGRGSFRALRAALSVCGLPRPFVRVNGLPGRGQWLEAGLSFDGSVAEFSGERLFRCWFVGRVSPVWGAR